MNTAIFPHTYRYREVNDTSLGETSMDGKFFSSVSDIYITFQLSPIFQSLPGFYIFYTGNCYTVAYIIWIAGVSPRLSSDVYFCTDNLEMLYDFVYAFLSQQALEVIFEYIWKD